MVFILYTIPVWVVVAVFLFAVGLGGAVLAWLAEHMLIISLIVWIVAYVAALICSEEGKKMLAVTLVTAYISAYVMTFSAILYGAHAFDEGDLFEMICALFGVPFGFFVGLLYRTVVAYIGNAIAGETESIVRNIIALIVVLALTVPFSIWGWQLKGY